MPYKWKVTWRESERGWGLNYFETTHNTEESAKDAIKRQRDKNPKDHVPDYYIVDEGYEQVWVDDPPENPNHVPRHRKED